MAQMARALPVLVLVSLVACGGSDGGGNPSGPSSPTPSTFTLTGTVSDQSTGQGISGATVTVVDGANAGKSTTTSGGSFSLTSLQPGGFTIRARAQYYDEASVGVTVTSNTSASMTMRPIPIFRRTGSGNTVFDMPPHVRRLRIIGVYTGRSSNFIVWIGGDLEVNELLGTFWGLTTYNTLNAVTGGITEVKESNGVSWSMTEER